LLALQLADWNMPTRGSAGSVSPRGRAGDRWARPASRPAKGAPRSSCTAMLHNDRANSHASRMVRNCNIPYPWVVRCSVVGRGHVSLWTDFDTRHSKPFPFAAVRPASAGSALDRRAAVRAREAGAGGVEREGRAAQR
jgi:hypothetical protein